jgi:acyl carrier protein
VDVSSSDVESQLAEYIENEIAYDRGGTPLLPDDPLLDGIIDSTSMLRLVLYIEEHFGVRVEDDELVPENFESVRKLAEFVDGKRS